MAQPPSRGKKGSDYFQTPARAIIPLLKFIPKDWHIWEPACGKGNLLEAFRKHDYEILGTDILKNVDFFEWKIPNFDCIVTNPPYSGRNKEKFLARCYELGKPFALLMPVDCLGGKARQHLYREFGIQLIMMGERINFIPPSGKGSGSWFDTCWFTNGLNLPNDIIFETITTN